jgi:hypothetical protein
MSRLVTVTVRSLFVSLGMVGLAAAQEPPPLEPPSLEPPKAGATPASTTDGRPKLVDPNPAAPARSSPVRPTAPKPEFRPMLAIPGVTAPSSRPSSAYRPPVAGPLPPGNSPFAPSMDALPLPSEYSPPRSPSSSAGFPLAESPSSSALNHLPRFDRPAPRSPAGAAGMGRPGTPAVTPPGDTIPLTIEPLDEERSAERGLSGRPEASRPLSGRVTGGPEKTPTRPDDEPIRPRPAPRRGGGVLGRLFGPPPAPLPPPSREEARADSKPSRDSNPESGPDPDVAVRRRIERQIRATLGDKVRSYEVSVTGRNVTIVAQPSRFWLRRSVRRSLEALPSLQGYRARIEVSE